ncbi:uncharacterized protein [Bos indicus]|uniref:Uncharacterized protein isoform X1 n=1 Tax=Bos indicus TaxID=9915 RepID=A0A6P5BYF6_BOSIN
MSKDLEKLKTLSIRSKQRSPENLRELQLCLKRNRSFHSLPNEVQLQLCQTAIYQDCGFPMHRILLWDSPYCVCRLHWALHVALRDLRTGATILILLFLLLQLVKSFVSDSRVPRQHPWNCDRLTYQLVWFFVGSYPASAMSNLLKFEAESMILRQGHVPLKYYLVRAGHLKVMSSNISMNKNTNSEILSAFGEGDFIGDLASGHQQDGYLETLVCHLLNQLAFHAKSYSLPQHLVLNSLACHVVSRASLDWVTANSILWFFCLLWDEMSIFSRPFSFMIKPSLHHCSSQSFGQ